MVGTTGHGLHGHREKIVSLGALAAIVASFSVYQEKLADCHALFKNSRPQFHTSSVLPQVPGAVWCYRSYDWTFRVTIT